MDLVKGVAVFFSCGGGGGVENSMCVLGGAGSIYLTNILSLSRNILVYMLFVK